MLGLSGIKSNQHKSFKILLVVRVFKFIRILKNRVINRKLSALSDFQYNQISDQSYFQKDLPSNRRSLEKQYTENYRV